MTTVPRAGDLASHGGAATGRSLSAGLDRARRTRELVEELIADPARLGPDVQPVRRLGSPGALDGATGPIVGWKATGRGQAGTELADTLALLAGAASLGLVERLDWAFRVHVLDAALAAGIREPVHLTPEPETFCGACPPRLAVAFGRGRRELQVAAEVHADAFADPSRLARAVEEYRGWGWQVVLADVSDELAADPALAAVVRRTRPDIVQVDLAGRHRPTSAGADVLLALADELGAEVMAVNVDTTTALTQAAAIGASTGRGLLLGTPRAGWPVSGPVGAPAS